MRIVKQTLIVLLVMLVGGFLHYTLPRHDVVQIVGTEQRRVELSGWNSIFYAESEPRDPQAQNRDVRFISALQPNDSPMVYRNEDTGWGWPPYFKFNASDLHARAASLTTEGENARWALVTKYGWRNRFISTFPNAVAIREVSGPNVTVFPWFNIIFLSVFAIVAVWVVYRVRRFFKRRVGRAIRDVQRTFETSSSDAGERLDVTQAKARTRWVRMQEWWTEKFG